jgi:hypothetical protein
MPLINEPVCLAVGTDGELEMPLRFVSGVEAVNVGLRVRCQLFRGEWFLDQAAGVPYWQTLLGQKFDERSARAAFRSELLTCPGVSEILALDVTFEGTTRTLKVAWQVRCTFGDTAADSLAISAQN